MSGDEQREGSVIREPAAVAPPFGEALREAGLPTGIDEIIAEQRSPDASPANLLWELWRDLVKELMHRDQPLPVAEGSGLYRERLDRAEPDILEDWRNLQERNRSEPELEPDF